MAIGADASQRKRPKDRRAQILTSARDLFIRYGFENVSMAAIANRVGITAGALYRHFENKTVLLESVFDATFGYLDDHAVGSTFDILIEDAMAKTTRPFASELWRREARHLPEVHQEALRSRMRSWTRAFVAPLRALRPSLDEEQLELLAWAIQALLGGLGTSPHNTQPLNSRVAEVRRAIQSVTTVQLEPTSPGHPPRHPIFLPMSMKERLLLTAIDLFGQFGYHHASMASIGASLDVTGQNLYGYFDSKSEILRAAIERGQHATWIAYEKALSEASTPQEAVQRAIRAQVGLSQQWSWAWTDARLPHSVPEDLTDRMKAAQLEYLDEWIALVARASDRSESSDLRFRVRLGFDTINDLSRTPHLATRASFNRNLEAIATVIILP